MLATLGHRRLLDFEVAIGYGTDKPDFWISTFDGIGPNREVHIAFHRTRRRRTSAPSMRPRSRWAPRRCTSRGCGRSTTTRYYGAFVRDPDGNNVEAVCHAGDAT